MAGRGAIVLHDSLASVTVWQIIVFLPVQSDLMMEGVEGHAFDVIYHCFRLVSRGA